MGFDATAPAKPATPLALEKLQLYTFNIFISKNIEESDRWIVSNHHS